ncbi:MAG: ABC transporter permease [Ktedonobacteraceae bacterium]|nr:ABC transporter permease [Ktedonobacteraceae bacterium]
MITFLALLAKELRLRMRRERTIWLLVVYLILMSSLGWLAISRYASPAGFNNNSLNTAGMVLYSLLSPLQLLLVLFVTPAFTATAINGEKERQTFDLLLCSRLSALSLVGGKLLAGLMNALLLIVASAPLFSLVFFFGGVSPAQVLEALLIYTITTIMVGTFGLLCSSIFRRPAVSTAIAYAGCLLWLAAPTIISYITSVSHAAGAPLPISSAVSSASVVTSNGKVVLTNSGSMLVSQVPLWLAWNPLTVLSSTYQAGSPGIFFSSGFTFFPIRGPVQVMAMTQASLHLTVLRTYLVMCTIVSITCFLSSALVVRPGLAGRIRFFSRRANAGHDSPFSKKDKDQQPEDRGSETTEEEVPAATSTS